MAESADQACKLCEGTGEVGGETCPSCFGDGLLHELPDADAPS